jgi:hypothetical protein
MFNKHDNHHSLLHGPTLPQTTPLHCCSANLLTIPSATAFVTNLLPTEVLQWNGAIGSEVQA